VEPRSFIPCATAKSRILSASAKAESGGTLRSAAQAHGFLVGASAELKPLGTDPAYAQTLAREYNVLTAENAMKFEPLRPTRSRFQFLAYSILAYSINGDKQGSQHG
jgi:endo-1,4-beta-xylanase